MKNFSWKSNSGFSLPEILVAILLFVMIMIVVSSLFIGQNRIYKTQTAELNITNDARNTLDDVDSYVRQANRTLASYGTYTASSQVLILQIPSLNSSNQLIAGKYDFIVYYLNNNQLYRQVYPDALSSRAAITKKLASNVNSLNFVYDNISFSLVKMVTTNLTIQENAGVQSRAITISSNSTLRNY